MYQALFTMVLAAIGGSLLTVASHRSMTRIDRLVLASIATASLLLGVCLLNEAVPGMAGTQALGSLQTASVSGAPQPAPGNAAHHHNANG